MYLIRYDARVAQDLDKIDASERKKIENAIESKLTTRPELFGKPLRQSLAGFRALRVSDYRVVYLLKGQEVSILLIGDRSHIYEEAKKLFG